MREKESEQKEKKRNGKRGRGRERKRMAIVTCFRYSLWRLDLEAKISVAGLLCMGQGRLARWLSRIWILWSWLSDLHLMLSLKGLSSFCTGLFKSHFYTGLFNCLLNFFIIIGLLNRYLFVGVFKYFISLINCS